MAKVIERLGACYDVQEVAYGTVYTWRPERVVVECQCGQRLSLTASMTSCPECGTHHGLAGTELSKTDRRHQSDQTLHPWHYYYYYYYYYYSEDRKEEDGGLPY